MEFLLILFLVIIAIVIFKISALGKKHDLGQINNSQYPYFKNSSLLTPAEISFRHTLKIAVGDAYDISLKVRLADLISVNKGLPKNEWSRAFNQIKAKHLDFVLVDKETTEILCGIELDDSSHNKLERQKRDTFLDAAMESAKLPLLRFKANHSYISKDIQYAIKSISEPLGASDDKSQVDEDHVTVRIDPELHISETFEPTEMKCPQCNAELVEREASKGSHIGEKFLGCSNFPRCRFRKPVGQLNNTQELFTVSGANRE